MYEQYIFKLEFLGMGGEFAFRFFSFFKKCIYLCLAVLSPHCCVYTFSSCSKQGLL